MYLFDEEDLRELILDEDLFPLFNLLDRERKILVMRVVKGFTFQFMAGILKIKPQRVHQIYKRSLDKMKKQIFVILKEYQALQRTNIHQSPRNHAPPQ